jgi:hypothetical protein
MVCEKERFRQQLQGLDHVRRRHHRISSKKQNKTSDMKTILSDCFERKN